jgi:hypothetical protein
MQYQAYQQRLSMRMDAAVAEYMRQHPELDFEDGKLYAAFQAGYREGVLMGSEEMGIQIPQEQAK